MSLRKRNSGFFWTLWLLLTSGLCVYFYVAVSNIEAGKHNLAGIFLPGQTTDGHHQIELACSACHTQPFGGRKLLQNACIECHAEELKRINDSHPTKKFTDPRNADTLAKLDARLCISCHVEHRPDMTGSMGVTQPDNFCFHCHADVGENRPTHRNLDFNSCGTSGCHNFHDNKALYEDFLLKHADKPANLPRQQVEIRDLLGFFRLSSQYPADDYPLETLTREQADAPQTFLISPKLHEDWLTTRHAQAGVNCSACHQQRDETSQTLHWVERPDHRSCKNCHIGETDSFLVGKHGMRLTTGLAAMTPAQARLPMKPDSHNRQLTCTSCHNAHRFDARKAATEACLQCHDDEHSRNYPASPHAALWEQEFSGQAPAGTGVSCATCHLPRIWHENAEGIERILVDHNQNNTLRPNDKMLRPVCMQCHGLGFSIDALADPDLIRRNFQGQPGVHIESIDMALEAERLHQEKKQRESR